MEAKALIKLDYEALVKAPVNADPFPHVLVRNFVRAPDLDAVCAGLPALGRGGSFPVGSLRLGTAAAALMLEVQGVGLRKHIAERFGLDLSGAPTMVTLRGQSREKDGRIHCDSNAKRVTVLLYLNPRSASWAKEEGCLRLLRGPTDIEDYSVQVPPVDGTLLVFPNGPSSWHGHRQFVGRRYVVQLNYMTDSAAAHAEIRRHRLSALVKRVVAA